MINLSEIFYLLEYKILRLENWNGEISLVNLIKIHHGLHIVIGVTNMNIMYKTIENILLFKHPHH